MVGVSFRRRIEELKLNLGEGAGVAKRSLAVATAAATRRTGAGGGGGAGVVASRPASPFWTSDTANSIETPQAEREPTGLQETRQVIERLKSVTGESQSADPFGLWDAMQMSTIFKVVQVTQVVNQPNRLDFWTLCK